MSNHANRTAAGRSRPRALLGRLVLVAWAAGVPTGAVAAVVAGHAGVADASTTTTSSPPSGTTSTTAPSGPPPPAAVSLLPCSAPRTGAPCAADPSQLQVNVPSRSDVTAVQLSWVAESGRATGVPSDNPPTILQVANQVACTNPSPAGAGQAATCWGWPGSMKYSSGGSPWVLNGSYQVTPCSGVSSSGGCNQSADLGSTQVQVAAPPGPPAGLSASSQVSTVTLTWQPSPEPDLVGYVISRNSEAVYTCSTNGFGPGAGRPCAYPPSFSDRPGLGTWTYQVEALRFGADTSPAHVVHSTGSTVGVALSPSATPGGPPSVHFNLLLPPIPPTGVMSPVIALPALPGRAPTTAAIGEGEPGVSQPNPNLPYNDNPALSAVPSAEATGTSERPPVKAVHSVDAAAELALAVIALSLAVHAWYVRDELRKAAARVAARQTIDPKGLQST